MIVDGFHLEVGVKKGTFYCVFNCLTTTQDAADILIRHETLLTSGWMYSKSV